MNSAATYTKIDLRKTERIRRIRYVFAPIAGLFVAGIWALAWCLFINIGELPVILPIFMGGSIGKTIRKISDSSDFFLAFIAVAETVFSVIAGRYLAFCWIVSGKLGIPFFKLVLLKPVSLEEFIITGRYITLTGLMEILLIILGMFTAWFSCMQGNEKNI